MERNNYSFGVILIFIGFMFLLLNLKVLTFNWILFILAIGLIIGYYLKENMGYLTAGLILLAISSVSLLNEYVFTSINIKGFVFLWIFGIMSLALYSKQKSKGLLIFGVLLPALGTYNLIEEIARTDVGWVMFLLFAIAFYIAYVVGYRQEGNDWPKHLSIIMLIISGLFLLSSKSLLKFGFWKFISYLWPILLIGIGIKIIYNVIKLKR
ncbi:hypothetical protein KQI42_14955 [Tissierella sp. MSJ-40]|uniref:DUF5668 domain-containing protein n=1 Tax=Tissierella simiarum TaxID=2841534 RepID=A0ABS6E8U1_9FIRM|nr:hypothetical protein [Tissierella simiarum]MBU5439321.1 hypothetical protein [Tissierella simiarum]